MLSYRLDLLILIKQTESSSTITQLIVKQLWLGSKTCKASLKICTGYIVSDDDDDNYHHTIK